MHSNTYCYSDTMKKLHYFLATVFFLTVLSACTEKDPTEKKIDEMIGQMTLEEKVGQMTQITLDVIGNGKDIYSSQEDFAIDTAKLRKALLDYHVGSVLNSSNNKAMSPEKWNTVIEQIQKMALENSKMKIPVVYGIDAIHGPTYSTVGTLFPQEIGLAATFNTELAQSMGQITAYETRACGIPWTFSPVLDLGADQRFSRIWEGFGEDPYLDAQMGVALTKGYEGDNSKNIDDQHIASCLKHYMGYSVPKSGKDRTPAYIPDHILTEYHLEPFREAVEAGSMSVMVNSSIINGESVHASKKLLTDILKVKLNFKGLIVTDWSDIINLYQRDHIARNHKEAIKLAINAGIDMSMVPYKYEDFCENLISLVEEGQVGESRIDDAVRRILRFKMHLGLFEKPVTYATDYPKTGSKEHALAAYQTAIESITLLKNANDILPLKPGSKILVSGPNANSMRCMNGGWSYSWQGEKAVVFASEYNTFLEAVEKKAGKENICYVPGISYLETGNYYEEKEDRFEQAVQQARKSDIVLLFLGENSYTEKPGDLNDLNLSDEQIKLANAMAATGKKVILILNEGRPRCISKIESKMQAVLHTYLPGNYGGDALADILFGDVNPSGKLPYTYPSYPNSLANYYHKPSEEQVGAQGAYLYESDYNPQYEFGHGLSYTQFEISNLSLDKTNFTEGDSILVNVNVKNTGQRAGKETVLLYSSDVLASITPDVKRLRKFSKIFLEAGESKTVKFVLYPRDLAFVNLNNEWTTEPGEFLIQIGQLKKEIEFK